MAPIILRFPQIIHHRLHALRAAFARAIEAARYQGGYHGAYPIKVNQQRRVVRAVLDGGAPHGVGLEAGSKPELMIAMGMQKAGGLILCNGFKDAEYLDCAPASAGLDVIIDRAARRAQALLELRASSRQRPQIGLRARPRRRLGQVGCLDRSKLGSPPPRCSRRSSTSGARSARGPLPPPLPPALR